jgi:hypothetical protein
VKAKKGRCSPTEALKLLRPPFEPTDAAVELTEAMHRDICPVICNGVIIKPDIARRLMVVAKKAHGRWTAHIVGNFAMGGVKPKDVWEFEIDKVKTLLPQPDTKAEGVQAAATAGGGGGKSRGSNSEGRVGAGASRIAGGHREDGEGRSASASGGSAGRGDSVRDDDKARPGA